MIHARTDYNRIQDPADAHTLKGIAISVSAALVERLGFEDGIVEASEVEILEAVEAILREVLVGDRLGGTPIAADEPVFLLRAQDKAAAGAVRAWAYHARRLGASSVLVEAALAHAHTMESWPTRKVADADPSVLS